MTKAEKILYKQARVANNIGFSARKDLKKWIDYFGPKYEAQKKEKAA